VINLVYYHGKTAKKVGEILCIPVATVKTRIAAMGMGAAPASQSTSSWNDKCQCSIH